MSNSLFGLTVARAIPPEVVTGLATGQYKLYGGVIRGAAGTEYAGQIIRHLLPMATQTAGSSIINPISGVFEATNTFQLFNISGQVNALTAVTQQVLEIASATMVLSGLNLAISLVGFAMLNEKLNNLEQKLNEIQKDVKEIRTLLELKERAELEVALHNLLNIANIKNSEHRQRTLFDAKSTLAPINLKYKVLLEGADRLETAMAYEEYFCLTALAHARCQAELGMLEMAYLDLERSTGFWVEQARKVANKFVFGKYPERFLFSDFAESVPVSVLAEWLDFAGGEEKGYGRIDELRGKTTSWYSRENYAEVVEGVSAVGKLLNKAISPKAAKLAETNADKQLVIPAMQKLVARYKVFEGYKSQYKFLEEHNVRPTEFENELALLGEDAVVNGYIILQPAETASFGQFLKQSLGLKR